MSVLPGPSAPAVCRQPPSAVKAVVCTHWADCPDNLSNQTPPDRCDGAGLSSSSSSPRCGLTAAAAGGHRATAHRAHSPPHTHTVYNNTRVWPTGLRPGGMCAGSVTTSPSNASSELVSALAKTHGNSMRIMLMSNMTLSVFGKL